MTNKVDAERPHEFSKCADLYCSICANGEPERGTLNEAIRRHRSYYEMLAASGSLAPEDEAQLRHALAQSSNDAAGSSPAPVAVAGQAAPTVREHEGLLPSGRTNLPAAQGNEAKAGDPREVLFCERPALPDAAPAQSEPELKPPTLAPCAHCGAVARVERAAACWIALIKHQTECFWAKWLMHDGGEQVILERAFERWNTRAPSLQEAAPSSPPAE